MLTSENGWLPGGRLRGLLVDVAFTAADQPAVAGAGSGAAGAGARCGVAGTLALAFIGGLILNLMPCVFPVLGIKILGFVNQAGHERGRIVTPGLVFSAGVLASFWALAAVLAVLRAGGEELGWGFQLQSAAFVYALAVLLWCSG